MSADGGPIITGNRATIVASLRQLADLLEGREDLPVPRRVDAWVATYRSDDAAARAAVDDVAAALGLPAVDHGGLYEVVTPGPVRYGVVYFPAIGGESAVTA